MARILTSLLIALALTATASHADNIGIASRSALDVESVDGFPLSRRLASVRIGADGGCSGTIIAVGDWHGAECAFGLTASHCGYKINDTFRIHFVDGSSANARCVDVDGSNDLMLFAVDAARVKGVSPVSRRDTHDGCYAVGFPGGVGPNEKRLTFRKTWEMNEAGTSKVIERHQWYVQNGHHAPGDSGGGIFADEYCIGVLTHGDTGDKSGNDLTIQAATHSQVASFLRRNKKIKRRECTDGTCTPDGPRDLWWLQPNVDIAVPEKPIRNPELIEDEHRRDINGEREKRKVIAELQMQVKLLTARVDELEKAQSTPKPIDDAPAPPDGDAPPAPVIGERGPAGPAGPPGRDGKDGESRSITVELRWEDGTKISSAVVPPNKSKVIQFLQRSKTVADMGKN